MTTKEVERGRNKCVPYWPEQQGDIKKFGKLVVEHRLESQTAEYVLREFQVYREPAEGDEKSIPDDDDGRTVWLYQYRTWPDHGESTPMGRIFYRIIVTVSVLK